MTAAEITYDNISKYSYHIDSDDAENIKRLFFHGIALENFMQDLMFLSEAGTSGTMNAPASRARISVPMILAGICAGTVMPIRTRHL